MKKYAFLAISAVVLFALSSCNKKEQQNEPSAGGDVTITVAPKTLDLAVGDEQKLTVKINPSGTSIKLTYTSSNSSVASVSEAGIVTGLASGEASIVVSAEGAKADTCHVTVKDWTDLFSWAGGALWNLDKSNILSNDTAVFTLRSGEEVHCILIEGSVHFWDNGITFTETAEGGTVSGAGHVLIATVPIYLITDDLDGKGPNYYYLGTDVWSIVDDPNYSMNDTAYAYCAGVNKIVGTAEQHHTWLEDTTGTAPAAITNLTNTMLVYIDYDAQDMIYFVGLVGPGVYGGDEYEALYKSNITWFEYGDYGYMGLAADVENRDWAVPYAWDNTAEKYYEYLGSEEEEVYEKRVAPKHIQGDFKPSKSSMLTNRFYEKK